MTSRKAAVLDVGKGLLNVSLAVLAAIGSASGNLPVAGLSALPAALLASGTLKPWLERKQEEPFELPVPPWWTERAEDWQSLCSHIEGCLPVIMEGVATRLQNMQPQPFSARSQLVRRLFVEEVARHLPWDIRAQDRALVAEYMTPPLLERSAEVLKTVLGPLQEVALADLLAKVALFLDEARQQQPQPVVVTPVAPALLAPPATEIKQVEQEAAGTLEEKLLKGKYDVYICYHEADEDAVLKIGEQLKERGVLPWFDIIDARPGKTFRAKQDEQIQKIPAAAIFVGTHAVKDWQALQMYAFLDQFVERECPVIPVLLKDAPEKPKLPPFLGTFTWVDFRRKMPDPLGQLIWGITGKRPSVH